MKKAIPWGRREEPGGGVELASSTEPTRVERTSSAELTRVELASLCWERGCAHLLHSTSSVVSGASNSPCGQGHMTLIVPATATGAVQQLDAIMREVDGAGCSVLLLVAGFRRNGRNEKKEEAILCRQQENFVF
jgi:hypothetical protein